MGGLNETIMEAEPVLSLPMGPVRTLGDNRVGWIPNCEDAAPPRCAPVCKATCCAFCAFCAVRYSNSARASGGTCPACYATRSVRVTWSVRVVRVVRALCVFKTLRATPWATKARLRPETYRW